ncbi:SIMPL domain-containing protein [Pedobacter arcticus]|uniref:SIMPL domain-containing protein n=1 Tax=Pedobacter arcticus TaxID=752140 RepID=UPI0002DFB1B6|nr:SIMPL domain-containing protein [Pedobacter arcticus]
MKNRFILPAIIMGVSAIIVAFVLAKGLKNIKSDQTINVTGSAKQLIVSDLGILKGNFNIEASTAPEAYNELSRQRPLVVQFLKSKGFKDADIDLKTINVYPQYNYNNGGQQLGVRAYSINQSLEVSSTDVNKIKDVSIAIASLFAQGLNFNVNAPEYYYTKLSDVKVDIQAAAAKDAMIRGEKVAEATNRSLGTLTNARMGVLQITPENSNMTSDYGINDVSSIRKEITAVVNANFEIE